MALFSDSKPQLREWKAAMIERLARLRLTMDSESAQVQPVNAGVPWLGSIVYPEYRRVKARKVVYGSRRWHERFDAWCEGTISFGEFEASVQS